MRKQTEERYKEVCRLYREGRTREQIAEETSYSRPAVDRILQKYGNVPARGSFLDHKEEVLALWEKGMTVKAIAERTGLGITTVCRNLKKLGKTRGRGGRKGVDIPPEEYMARKREKKGSAGYAGRRMKQGDTEDLPLKALQYARHVRRIKMVRVKVKWEWKTMQDVSDWYL